MFWEERCVFFFKMTFLIPTFHLAAFIRMTTPEYLIQTQRLGLRQWLPTDREPFIAMNADPEVMEHFPEPYSEEKTDKMLSHTRLHFAQYGYGWWAVDHLKDNTFIGAIGLNNVGYKLPFTPCVEIAWRLRKEYWKKGLATEGATAALFYAFQVLKLPELVSFTSTPNQGSRKIMQKLGMTRKKDFNHPMVEKGHPLEKHVLYKITREEYLKQQGGK